MSMVDGQVEVGKSGVEYVVEGNGARGGRSYPERCVLSVWEHSLPTVGHLELMPEERTCLGREEATTITP